MISVALPTSIVVNEPGLLLKTLKIHQVVRYSSIFGIDEIVFYYDGFTPLDKHRKAMQLIGKIWRYLITPPYLRRKLIPRDPDLRYVGLLYPLRLEIFSVDREVKTGDKRLGYIVRRNNSLYADIGLDKLYKVEGGRCSEGEIVLVEVVDPYTRRVVCVDEEVYRGPILGFEDSFKELITYYRNRGFYIIATSRYGKTPSNDELRELAHKRNILVLFGSPRHGLYDIAEKNNLKLEENTDKVWNMVPKQRVKTIRTEEALLITLSIFNMYIHGFERH